MYFFQKMLRIVIHTAHFIRGTSWERRNWMFWSLCHPCAVGKSNQKF